MRMMSIELNGETDDEDTEGGEMGFDEGSAQVRNIRDPGQPTVKEHQEHMTTSTVQIMVQVLRDGTRGERTAQEIGCSRRFGRVPHVSMDYGFLERESEEQVSPVLVIRERRHKMTWGMLVPTKGTKFPWIAKRAARFIDQLGHNRVTLRCDDEPAIEALAREIGQARQERSQTNPERMPAGESQSSGIIERAVGLVAGQARTLKAALEHRMGTRVPPDAKILCWLVGNCCVPDEQVRRRQRRKDAATQTAWPKGQHTYSGMRRKDFVHASQASKRVNMGTAIPSQSVCGDAELVVRGSGCHRARDGDQDTPSEHQENPCVGEMGRGQNTRNTSRSMVPKWH